MKSVAVIIVFDEPVEEKVAELLIAELEDWHAYDFGELKPIGFHAEHFTQARARKLIRADERLADGTR